MVGSLVRASPGYYLVLSPGGDLLGSLDNSRIFEGKARGVEEIIHYIHGILLEWVAIWPNFEDKAWDYLWREEL